MKNVVKLITLSVLTLGVQNALAASVIVDGRFDSTSMTYNDEAKAANTSVSNYSAFQGSRLRLNMNSKIKDDLTGALRLNLLVANSIPSTESKISKYIDFAYLQQQINPMFYVTAGKVIAAIGGREAMNNPGDYYFVSMAGNEIVSRDTSGLWPVGVILGMNMDEQKIELEVANTTSDDTNTTGTAPSTKTSIGQTRLMAGLSYIGSFNDKKILPVISFHRDAESDNTEARDYMALGSKFIFDSFDFEMDYLSNVRKFKTWAANDSKNMQSIVGSFRYKMSEAFHMLAKVESSTDEIAATASVDPAFTKVKYMQAGLAAEFYPYNDVKFRYHFAAAQKQKKIEDADATVETTVLAGIRISHDFLK